MNSKCIYMLIFLGLGGDLFAEAANDFSGLRKSLLAITQQPLSLGKTADLVTQVRRVTLDTKASDWQGLKWEYLALIFTSVDACANSMDLSFDFSVFPMANIAPPSDSGMPAGIDPSAIKDQKSRKEYELALEANRKYAILYNDQYDRREYMDELLNSANVYLRAHFTPGERSAALKSIGGLKSNNTKTKLISLIKALESNSTN